MSNSLELTLYTQNGCKYCAQMIAKLLSWNYNVKAVNISGDKNAKNFLKESGHNSVPQLYWNKKHIFGGDVNSVTKDQIEELIDYENHVGGPTEFRS